MAPYQPEQHVEEQEFDDSVNSEGLRVLACSISPNPDTPAFLAMLDGGGQVNDYLRLRYLLNRRNTNKAKEREDKVSKCGFFLFEAVELISQTTLQMFSELARDVPGSNPARAGFVSPGPLMIDLSYPASRFVNAVTVFLFELALSHATAQASSLYK